MKTSQNIADLAIALAKAQGEIPKAAKNGTVNYKDKKTGRTTAFAYSTLDDLKDVARGPLSKYGIAIVQPTKVEGRKVTVTTRLMLGDQYIENDFTLVAGDERPQSIGSAQTYAQRYSYASMLGMSSDQDDDGGRASEEHDVEIEDDQPEQTRIYLSGGFPEKEALKEAGCRYDPDNKLWYCFPDNKVALKKWGPKEHAAPTGTMHPPQNNEGDSHRLAASSAFKKLGITDQAVMKTLYAKALRENVHENVLENFFNRELEQTTK